MRLRNALVVALFLLALWPTALPAQYNPFLPVQVDARQRRAWREQGVAYAGGDAKARAFVESCDEATLALSTVSPDVARRLAEAYPDTLGQFPRQRDLLRVIGAPGHGDDVALYALRNVTPLTDVDNFDAFLAQPLEIALGLKTLEAAGAQRRAWRLNAHAQADRSIGPFGCPWSTIGWWGGGLALVGLWLWRRRRAQAL